MSKSRDREWRAGYRAAIDDALEALQALSDERKIDPIVRAEVALALMALGDLNPKGERGYLP